jgi:hypothetical protein
MKLALAAANWQVEINNVLELKCRIYWKNLRITVKE